MAESRWSRPLVLFALVAAGCGTSKVVPATDGEVVRLEELGLRLRVPPQHSVWEEDGRTNIGGTAAPPKPGVENPMEYLTGEDGKVSKERLLLAIGTRCAPVGRPSLWINRGAFPSEPCTQLRLNEYASICYRTEFRPDGRCGHESLMGHLMVGPHEYQVVCYADGEGGDSVIDSRWCLSNLATVQPLEAGNSAQP